MKDLFKFSLYCLISVLVLPGYAEESAPRASTVSDNVHILEHQLVIPGLDRKRTIRLYLPPEYELSETRYPVLYMHDAQNLYDDATSYAGEWKVDETLNQLALEDKLSLIVVGIDNGENKRLNELSPWSNDNFGEAEGKAYVDFIVNTLKPWVDQHYRTLTDAGNTAVMGSSMGGLISHYAIFEHPDVFSKAGIFSPSYWYSDEVFTFTSQHPLTKSHRLYLIVSQNEGDGMTDNFTTMTTMLANQNPQVYQQIHSYGNHNEAYWAGEFEKAILWLFENGK